MDKKLEPPDLPDHISHFHCIAGAGSDAAPTITGFQPLHSRMVNIGSDADVGARWTKRGSSVLCPGTSR